jgi:hypothetical protein
MVSVHSFGTGQAYVMPPLETLCLAYDAVSGKLPVMPPSPETTPPSQPPKSPIAAGVRVGRVAKAPPAIPHWAYAFGIAVIVLVLLFFIVHFAGLMPMHG